MCYEIEINFCVWLITGKCYFVSTQYSLSILQNSVLFKKILIQKTVSFTTLYIEDDIVIVFTMAFKCVLKILKTYVNFTALQKENYISGRKMFTSRTLTGVETLLTFSILFQLNENTNKYIANSDNSDCISHPNTHTHTHTHTHILYICICIYIYIYTHTHFIYIYLYIYTHTHFIYMYMYIHIYIDTHTFYIYVYTYRHTHTHKHTHTFYIYVCVQLSLSSFCINLPIAATE